MQDFIQRVEEAFPRDLVLNFDKIKAYAEHKFKPARDAYLSPWDFTDFVHIYPEMIDWVNEQVAMPRPDPAVSIPHN